jgi:hypothetical protein
MISLVKNMECKFRIGHQIQILDDNLLILFLLISLYTHFYYGFEKIF